MLSEQIIKKESKQYDCKVIQRLKLERKGFRDIANIDILGGLLELSLAWNEITQIQGLDSLVTLKRLDLSHNKISKVENLSQLESLTHLDLSSNLITGLDCFGGFVPLPELRSLKLQGSQGEDSNPVCSHVGYLETIYRLLPGLIDLDGGSVEVLKALNSVLGDPKSGPDGLQDPTPAPIENWIPPVSLEVDSFFLENIEKTKKDKKNRKNEKNEKSEKDEKDKADKNDKNENNVPVYRDSAIENITSSIAQKLSGECSALLKAFEAALSNASAT